MEKAADQVIFNKENPVTASASKWQTNLGVCVCVSIFSSWKKMIETVDSRQGEMNAKTCMD